MVGAFNGGVVRPVSNYPADSVEYSIYFLSAGEVPAQNVWVCDLIPENTTFVPDAYASGPPADPAADQTNLLGLALDFNGSERSLTGADDGDIGYYLAPGVDPTTQFPDVTCDGPNTTGAIVLDLGNLPQATGVGTPLNA